MEKFDLQYRTVLTLKLFVWQFRRLRLQTKGIKTSFELSNFHRVKSYSLGPILKKIDNWFQKFWVSVSTLMNMESKAGAFSNDQVSERRSDKDSLYSISLTINVSNYSDAEKECDRFLIALTTRTRILWLKFRWKKCSLLINENYVFEKLLLLKLKEKNSIGTFLLLFFRSSRETFLHPPGF